MNDIPNTPDPIVTAIEQMKRDAFASGWKAAMDAVLGAVANLPAPEGADSNLVGPSALPAKPPTNGANLPTVGTTPWYVLQAVQKRQGMTGAEVIEAVRADGHTAAEPQIRTALSRLEKRQILANRHKKWFLK